MNARDTIAEGKFYCSFTSSVLSNPKLNLGSVLIFLFDSLIHYLVIQMNVKWWCINS